MGQAPGARLADPRQVGGDTIRWRTSRWLSFGLLFVLGCGPANPAQPAARPSPTPFPVPTLDLGQVLRGRELFVRHCASCHGTEAQGAADWQQPDARGDLPAPPHDDTGHTWRHSDAQLSEIIRGGLRDQFNKTPELTMPPFQADQLSDQEINDVLAYFKSLWSAEHRQFQEEQNRRPPIPMPSPNAGGGR